MAETTVAVPGSDGVSRAKIICTVTAETNDSANNRTLVRILGRILDNSTSFGGFGTGSWSATLDGVSRGSGSVAYNFTGNSANVYTVINTTFFISHATNGSKTVSGSVTFNGNQSIVGEATATATQGLTDYVRLPTTPAAPTLARSDNGTTLTITGAVATFFGSSPSYQYQTSTNGGATYSTAATLGTNRISSIAVTDTDSFVARTRAIDSEGTGSYSANSTLSIGIPSFTGEGTDTEVDNAILETTYSDQVIALRATNYSIFSGSLPTGLSLNTDTGAITGTPSSAATFSFVITAANITGSVESEEFTITVVTPIGGELDTTFNTNTGTGANGSINVILIQPDGEIVVGGQFTIFNGVTVNRIARLNANGTLDTGFDANTGDGLNSDLKAMAIQYEKTIVIGGAFTTFNSISKPRVTRISGDITP